MNKQSILSKKTREQFVLPRKEVQTGKVTIRQPSKEVQKRRVFNPPPLEFFPEAEQRRAHNLYQMRMASTSNRETAPVSRPGRISKEEMKVKASPFNYTAPTLCSASSQMGPVSSCGQSKEDCGCGCSSGQKTGGCGGQEAETSSCGTQKMQHGCQSQQCCCCCCSHHPMSAPASQNYPYPYEPEPGSINPLV